MSESSTRKGKSKRGHYIPPSDLKTILHSKRANIFYLEYCRVLVSGGRVEYVTEEGKESAYWNIPIANTTTLLLGNGTSITQAAMRELAKAGVMVGFCGGGGTPLFAGTDRPQGLSTRDEDIDIDPQDTVTASWLSPHSEYRPTGYLQAWTSFWFEEDGRLAAAKAFQEARINQVKKIWIAPRMQKAGFHPDINELEKCLEIARQTIQSAETTVDLLTSEARLTKNLFRLAAQAMGVESFTREKRGKGEDDANRFLDHGNYLAYGLGATVAWVLGVPFGLAVLHGKTRRGGLVFDIADLVKDALILPQAFISASEGDDEQQFRGKCIRNLINYEALDFMIDVVERTALETAKDYGRQAVDKKKD